MIETIETFNGLAGNRYTIWTDALGIHIDHETIDAEGYSTLAAMATLMIDAADVALVVAAIRRAAAEVRQDVLDHRRTRAALPAAVVMAYV